MTGTAPRLGGIQRVKKIGLQTMILEKLYRFSPFDAFAAFDLVIYLSALHS